MSFSRLWSLPAPFPSFCSPCFSQQSFGKVVCTKRMTVKGMKGNVGTTASCLPLRFHVCSASKTSLKIKTMRAVAICFPSCRLGVALGHLPVANVASRWVGSDECKPRSSFPLKRACVCWERVNNRGDTFTNSHGSGHTRAVPQCG